jgi:hypothetical protein
MPELYYTHFDFHGECKNMRWDRISVLTDRLNDGMLSDGCVRILESNLQCDLNASIYRYFHLDSSQPAPIKLQKGVVRTNCMDNLDRTNIVQSALGKLMLTHQLQATGILTPKESVDDFEDLCKNFRERAQFPSLSNADVDLDCSLGRHGRLDCQGVRWFGRHEG